ncbi:isocitrate lyase/phosphoenolpyruvate mutase family protein [Spirillospora sp. NPDC048911]|uniref:isocitrate lyase/PEP mutase family protein n=1 Tax=Spirillospora sp. NPDC048911 TaxID=3364527 RepID=UPI00371CF353
MSKAQQLRSLHDGLLVLPNAWDVASAVAIAQAGAAAVGTTSAGIAWSLGSPDGHRLSREEMVEAIARIVAAVDIPVSADIENGYGESPADVAETVRQVVAVGAAGINLEDSRSFKEPLHTPEEQAARLQAAREAGGRDLVINARTDVYFSRAVEPGARAGEVRARAKIYAEAGADCLFVPGLLDLDELRSLSAESPLPINVMADPGGPDVRRLADAGVRRISLGAALHLATYAATHRAVTTLLRDGTYEEFADASEVAPKIVKF